MRLILFIVILLLLSCEEPMVDGCTTTTACNYNADANKDDGSCLVNDCAGECGGGAVIDECEVCGGGGIADGACDCDGNTEDCAGECGGDAVEDECGVCNSDQPIGPYQCCDGFIPNCTPMDLMDNCCLTRFVADGKCDGADQPYGCDLRCYDCAVKECNGWPCPIEDYPNNCVDGNGEILPLCGNPAIDSCIEAVYNESWNPEEYQDGDGGDCECTPMTLADCPGETNLVLCGEWPDGCGGTVDCGDLCSEIINYHGDNWPLYYRQPKYMPAYLTSMQSTS